MRPHGQQKSDSLPSAERMQCVSSCWTKTKGSWQGDSWLVSEASHSWHWSGRLKQRDTRRNITDSASSEDFFSHCRLYAMLSFTSTYHQFNCDMKKLKIYLCFYMWLFWAQPKLHSPTSVTAITNPPLCHLSKYKPGLRLSQNGSRDWPLCDLKLAPTYPPRKRLWPSLSVTIHIHKEHILDFSQLIVEASCTPWRVFPSSCDLKFWKFRSDFSGSRSTPWR